MAKVYQTWRDYPLGEWRWPNFSPQEMACRGTGKLMIDPESMDKLQALRTRLGKPLIVTSAYRSPEHNKAVGGAPGSQHLLAKAFDVRMENHYPAQFEREARAVGFAGFGHYPKSNFMHIDTGPARRWNDGAWFQVASQTRTSPTPEYRPEPKRETIVEVITKPEVLTGAGGVLTGAGAISQGSGPVQLALGIVLVIVVCAFVAYLVSRVMTRPKEV